MGNQIINTPQTTEYTDEIGTFEILGVRRGKSWEAVLSKQKSFNVHTYLTLNMEV